MVSKLNLYIKKYKYNNSIIINVGKGSIARGVVKPLLLLVSHPFLSPIFPLPK
jgi:hypothetical protein